jgi:CBS domain-containing membrane protein
MHTVDEIMTADVLTLQPEEPISKAMALMAEMNIRHVPVVDKKHQLLGIVSHRDILRADLSCLDLDEPNTRSDIETSPIKSIMSEKICTASPKDSLLNVGQILQREKFGCVPIVENGVLAGIITDTDYVAVAITLIEEMEDFDDAVDDDGTNMATLHDDDLDVTTSLEL